MNGNVPSVRCRRRCIALSFVWKDTKKWLTFLSSVLGTGEFYNQPSYLSSMHCLSIQHWSGMGEKVLWQKLVEEQALCVLSMCLVAKGWYRSYNELILAENTAIN